MNENIIKQIKVLPPLPKSILEIERITSSEDSSIADLVKVIKQDPLLTANLLKVANSPLYGFSKEIKSVDQVVALFGMSTIKGFAISFAIKNSMKFDLSAYGITENRFHTVSNKRNALIINWFRKDRKRLEVLATDSFLIDIGAVIASLVLESENRADEFRKELTADNKSEIERKFLGNTSEEISAEMFKHWRFSDDLVEAMLNIDSPKGEYLKESAALLVSKIIFNLLEDRKEYIEKGIDIAKKYDLNFLSLEESLNKIGVL